MRTQYLVLDNIRSAQNVGAIFRTAECAGVAHIFLVGTTPAPTDRFGRAVQGIAKVALGAEKAVPYTYHATVAECLAALRAQHAHIAVIEQDPQSVPYTTQIQTDTPIAFVCGNEVTGVSQEFLSAADTILEIPLLGTKESLNVSVATGIVLFAQLCTVELLP